MKRTPQEFDRVFGPESKGDNESARAASSHKLFVRSQVQLGQDHERATGRKISALEAYRSYGWDILSLVAEAGTAPLVKTPQEPASTFKARREALNLTVEQVARGADISAALVQQAETPGSISRIRDLERIAQTLALKDYLIGVKPGAGGDADLSVRLRDFAQATDAKHFSPSDVLGLAEAAWVISTQADLSRLLQQQNQLRLRERFHPNGNYDYPAYTKGYALAAETRKMLGIGEADPIPSIKRLVEEVLGIPVVQEQLAERFAGATVANVRDRGMVVNERGQNANVWVRRMTIAHELCHLLWDPDTALDRLRVDQYDDLQADYERPRDRIEIRANAFAISFLAPPKAIENIATRRSDTTELIAEVMNDYGISATAASYHVGNITRRATSGVSIRDLPSPSHEWIAAENMTVDWFPLNETPISRRGRFAQLVVNAYRKGLISGDTGAGYLRSSEDTFRAHQRTILNAN